ncbi:hypothetical protein C7M52_00653 [Mixta theicola]|nr:DUF3304 domain-containing protein [Mixta theicola]QHM74711.1 hypothetical protein C7M52_00653 [Mixta theicola]
MKQKICGALCACFLLTGCDGTPEAGAAGGGGGTIKAINHTRWAINHFSVNGQSGIDIIGPYQGGGGGCCYGVPAEWRPGMMVQVDWQTGAGGMDGFPGFDKREEYHEWKKHMKALSRDHSQSVPLPDYSGQETCGITVHFLPCDRLKVTTSCYGYGHPAYPIKDPIQMEEPEVCPK